MPLFGGDRRERVANFAKQGSAGIPSSGGPRGARFAEHFLVCKEGGCLARLETARAASWQLRGARRWGEPGCLVPFSARPLRSPRRTADFIRLSVRAPLQEVE